MTQSAVRLSLDTITDLDDDVLARLDAAVPDPLADAYSIDLMEPKRGLDELDEPDDQPPFDLEVIKPRAVDVRKLWALTGQEVPAEIQAAVGARVPILLHQGLTPFHPAGAPKRGVWGLGYEIRVNDLDASTVSLAPTSRSHEVGQVVQKAQLGLGVGGALAVPDTALTALRDIPGVTLEGSRSPMTASSASASSCRCRCSRFRPARSAPAGRAGTSTPAASASTRSIRSCTPCSSPRGPRSCRSRSRPGCAGGRAGWAW